MKSKKTKTIAILFFMIALVSASISLLDGANCTASNSCGVECETGSCESYRCWSYSTEGGGVGCVCDNIRVIHKCEGGIEVYIH